MNAISAPREFWRSRLDVPNYELRDAARYARVHSNTVSRWHKDTSLADRESRAKLSYLQLVELAVVAACRQAGMKLPDIRLARAYYAGAFKTKHPFATLKLKTDGVDLAVDAGANLLIGNRGGQMAWKSFIGEKFKEFEYEDGLATRWHVAGANSSIVIDPRIEFGAPNIDGVPTWALRGRWEAGEGISDIADDFGIKNKQVVAALSFEGVDVAANPRPAWKH